MEWDGYGEIMRMGWVEDVKRDLMEWGKEEKDGEEVVDMVKRFYGEEKKDKVGVNGWRVEEDVGYGE